MHATRTVMVLVIGIASTPAWAATCHIDPFQATFGSDVETRMVVKSGTTCGVSMLMGGPGRTVNAGGPTSMAISQQAAHGVARTSGTNQWGYTPQRGYVGQDRFVVDSTGEIMAQRIYRGTSHFTIDVDVVP